MRHHKLHLTRRLVLNMSNDEEQEERVVERYGFESRPHHSFSKMSNFEPFESLRDIGMPADYVNKLTRMFQDIRISKDLNENCKQELKNDLLNIKGLY